MHVTFLKEKATTSQWAHGSVKSLKANCNTRSSTSYWSQRTWQYGCIPPPGFSAAHCPPHSGEVLNFGQVNLIHCLCFILYCEIMKWPHYQHSVLSSAYCQWHSPCLLPASSPPNVVTEWSPTEILLKEHEIRFVKTPKRSTCQCMLPCVFPTGERETECLELQ